MNSENFHEFVKNPSMLHQVSYQELKSLVLQYPYSPNLRYLLLLKSLFEQSKDFDKNQVMASLSSPDRKKLRQIVKQYSRLREMQENYTLNEDFLELKDLSSLESMMDEFEAEATVAPAKETGAAMPPPASPHFTLEDLDEEPMEDSDLGFLEGSAGSAEADESAPTDPVEPENTAAETTEPALDTSFSIEELGERENSDMAEVPTEVSPNKAARIELTEEIAPEQAEAPKPVTPEIPLEITNETNVQPLPLPKSSFNKWLRQLKPPQTAILSTDLKDISLNNKPHQHHEEEIAVDAKQIAEQSVEEDGEIASETLALILEKQKFYTKAISMYQRLKLLYPEKSSLFAAKIEELNKKI